MTEQEYQEMQKKALEQIRTGESMFNKDGAFGPLLKQFLEAALESEMETHLDESERLKGNKRNGRGKKTIKATGGEVTIFPPADRQSSFEPHIVKKRETILAENLSNKIISLYGIGMSLRDISSHIEEMYDMNISPTTLSQITDRIIPEIRQWQNRPLDSIYPVVYLDAMHYKVKEEGKIQSRALYTIIGINKEGKKDLLGMYVSESEGASFWLQVLTDLNNRGLEDILIACIDNLKGFPEAISSIYPACEIQTCIIHQIRNSLKYVTYKDRSEFVKDLKLIYKADTKDIAEDNLIRLADKWGKKYHGVIKSWQTNWDNLSTYFDYTDPIRRLIYTTNIVEGFHRQVRKVTKTKGHFTSDMALIKLVYLAARNITKTWTRPQAEWAITIQQLLIRFEGRIKLDI